MKDKIEQFLAYKASIEAEFKQFCEDTNIPLDERWDLFVKSDLGTINRYIASCAAVRNILERVGFTDKYSTITYSRVIGWIDDDYDDNDQPIKRGEINEIKEYALQTFEKGFTFDW